MFPSVRSSCRIRRRRRGAETRKLVAKRRVCLSWRLRNLGKAKLVLMEPILSGVSPAEGDKASGHV